MMQSACRMPLSSSRFYARDHTSSRGLRELSSTTAGRHDGMYAANLRAYLGRSSLDGSIDQCRRPISVSLFIRLMSVSQLRACTYRILSAGQSEKEGQSGGGNLWACIRTRCRTNPKLQSKSNSNDALWIAKYQREKLRCRGDPLRQKIREHDESSRLH